MHAEHMGPRDQQACCACREPCWMERRRRQRWAGPGRQSLAVAQSWRTRHGGEAAYPWARPRLPLPICGLLGWKVGDSGWERAPRLAVSLRSERRDRQLPLRRIEREPTLGFRSPAFLR